MHIGRGHQHDEAAELFRNAYTGGYRQTQTVDDGGDDQEGDAHQQLLQGDGNAEEEGLPDVVGFGADVLCPECKGQLLPADNDQRKNYADSLSRYCGDGCTGGTHVESGNQNQIADDIQYAGDGNGDQGHGGIADAPENTAHQIVGHDKERADGADDYVRNRLVKSLCRSLHQNGQRPGKGHQRHRHR